MREKKSISEAPFSEEALQRFMESLAVEEKLNQKSDCEIADLLLDAVWAYLPLGSTVETLVDQAIDRLRAKPFAGEMMKTIREVILQCEVPERYNRLTVISTLNGLVERIEKGEGK